MMKLHDFQLKAYNELRLGYKHGHKHQLLMSPTGSGKCLGKGTPVMLWSGKIVPVEDIKVGDRLMGPDGTPRRVVSLARGEEMLYRVNQYYGKDYVVNESHILSLKTIDGRIKNMSVTEYLEAVRAGNKEVLSGWKSLVNKYENLSYQIALTKEGVGEYFGFEITGKDRLFLLGDFTVTHNTVCALHLAKSAITKGKRVVFVADRITLINQTIERAYQFGIDDVGAIQADHPLRRPDALFQVASSQTLARRDWPSSIGLVVIDEAHSRGKAWINYLKENPDVAAIGLSATPYTKGLGKMFTNLVCADTMANLTKNGYLVPLEVYTCKQPELSDEHLDFTGEWKESHVEKEELKIVGDVIEEWKRKANGLKTIVFGRTILYCNELVERFNREGIFAAAFTNQTNKKERESLVRSFKDGQLRVLVSVEALAKGFDETSVECIIDARPMRKSLSTVQQMWGRGVRAHPGKTKCILLDFSGNVYRFWPDFERIYHNGLDKLDDGVKLDTEARQTKNDDEEQRSCPKCGFQPFAKICMECGYEKQKAKSDVKEEEGDLKPITIVVNGSKNKVKKEEVYLQLCKYAKDKGMKMGWAYYQYINMAKEDPKREWNIGLEDRIKEVQVGDAVLHFLRVKELRKMCAMAKAGSRK